MWAADETFDDTGALAGGDGLVPGRRMITDRLPVQLKGLEGAPGPAPAPSPAWADVHDDPFGMHLVGESPRVTTAAVSGGTAAVAREAA